MPLCDNHAASRFLPRDILSRMICYNTYVMNPLVSHDGRVLVGEGGRH
jgi:hypothetical protein